MISYFCWFWNHRFFMFSILISTFKTIDFLYDSILSKDRSVDMATLASPSSLECEERKWFTEEINEVVRCAKNIEEMIRPLVERLCRGIFKKRTKVAMWLDAITKKPMEIQEIQESNNSEEGVGVV